MGRKKPKQDPPPTVREERPAAYFLSLSLENIRCFGKKQTLDLSDGQGKHAKWTVLLGENGTGKTTVLQALAAFWAEWMDYAAPNERSLFNYLPLYFTSHLRALDSDRGILEIQLGKAKELSLTPQSHQYRMVMRREGDGVEFSPEPDYVPKTALFAYGSSRRPSSTDAGGRTHPLGLSVLSLFDANISLRNPERWLIDINHNRLLAHSIQHRDISYRKAIQILVDILPEVKEIEVRGSDSWTQSPKVWFKTCDGWHPLACLGYGYQTTTAWVVDLVSRMIEFYPNSPDPLAEPVIVLVDEIELHLHPRWQRKLMEDLDRFFPNAQFIVTTHSPLVVQSAPNANLAVLRRKDDHVEIDDNLDAIRNWRVDQILTSELFGGISPYPPEQEKILERRAELLQKKKKTPAEETELQQLEEQSRRIPSGSTPEQVRIFEELRKTLDILKQHTPKP